MNEAKDLKQQLLVLICAVCCLGVCLIPVRKAQRVPVGQRDE